MQPQDLPTNGFLRLPQIIGRKATDNTPGIPALIPVCASTWWAGVRAGRFPEPVKLSPRVTVWRAEDVKKLLDSRKSAA